MYAVVTTNDNGDLLAVFQINGTKQDAWNWANIAIQDAANVHVVELQQINPSAWDID